MKNDENWESEIDWSKRTTVVGGTAFYEFVKDKAIPVLDDGIRQLEAAKARCEDKMRRWGGIAERAGKLADSFAALIECEDFMSMVQDFDEKTTEMFKGAGFPTLGGWMRIGKRFTDALRDGSSVPTKYGRELAAVNNDIANASAVRDVLRHFVAASDDDYRLRCAPERFRTRVFRDFARDVNDLTVAGAKVDFGKIPGFLDGIAEALKVIIEVGTRLHGICRRAKKSIKRSGSAFWARLDGWNAIRLAV